jgi:ATP-dependent DNA ligase
MMKAITMHGGEGMMLRKMSSLYEHGRTNSLSKFKVNLSIHYYYCSNTNIRLHMAIKKESSLKKQIMTVWLKL